MSNPEHGDACVNPDVPTCPGRYRWRAGNTRGVRYMVCNVCKHRPYRHGFQFDPETITTRAVAANDE